jgi:hypothetical protein
LSPLLLPLPRGWRKLRSQPLGAGSGQPPWREVDRIGPLPSAGEVFRRAGQPIVGGGPQPFRRSAVAAVACERRPAALSGFLRRSPSMPYSSALIRRCLPATLCGPVFSHQAAKRGASIFKMMDVVPLPTRSYISAVTLLLCTVGNVVLAQEGQTTTAKASANNRGDACAQSIDKVINLCMMRGLNNIGPVKCDCVQDGPKWTCTGVASCVK